MQKEPGKIQLATHWHFLFFVLLLMSVGSTLVYGETADTEELFEMSLEQLMEFDLGTVYTASKFEQKISEAPSTVTVIDADEIRLYGYRTLSDVLESVPGFYTTYDRSYGYLGVRGFGRPGDYSSRVLLLIDGHRLNENISDSPPLVHDFVLDVDLIEKVEIARGPGSALYGSNAFFAVINVITKSGSDYNGLELSGGGGEQGTESARATYGQVFGDDLEALVSGSYYDRDGQSLYYDEFGGSADNDDDQSKSFLVKLSYSDWTFLATHVEREKGIPTAPWGTIFADRRTWIDDTKTQIGLTFEHAIDQELSMLARIAYNQYDFDGDYAYDDGGEYVNYDVWKGRWWVGELQFTKVFSDTHRVIFGSEAQYNVRQDQGNFDEYGIYLDDQQHSKSWGIYIQDELHLNEKLILSSGIRQDYYDSFGFSVNPRAGLIYKAFDDTTFKFLYGTAFRAPSVYELYYHDNGESAKSNPNLQPEEVESFEVVCEQTLNEIFHCTISGYYNTVDDLISQQEDPVDGLSQFQNVSEVTAKGLETTLQGRWGNGARMKTSYSYVRTHDKSTRSTLTNSPEHMVHFNVMYPVIAETLYAGVDSKWTSKRKTLAGNKTGNSFVTNLTLTYENLARHLQVQVGIYNLFDENYEHPGFDQHLQDSIEQDGRTVGMKMTCRF